MIDKKMICADRSCTNLAHRHSWQRTSETILKALGKDREKTREIIFGLHTFNTSEAEAMRLFIESRQSWCSEKILSELGEMLNK